MHARAGLRFVGVRAALVGAIATIVGVLGHTNAGGAAPDLQQMCLLGFVCSAASAPFLVRPAGWARLAILLLVEQVVVHTSLMAFALSSRGPMPSMPGMPGMPDMPDMRAGATSTAPMSLVPSAQMLAMHALAAAVVALWLWRGERALARLMARAQASIRVLWRPVAVRRQVRPRPATSSWLDLHALWSLRCAQSVSRRGPPAAHAV